MKYLLEILEFFSNIQSFIGLVAAVLFCVVFVCWIIYKRTKPARAQDTPTILKFTFNGVLILTIVSILLYFTLVVLDRTGVFIDRTPTVPIFHGRVHLGDNAFSRIGGTSLPKEDAPGPTRHPQLMFYDKETARFFTGFGLPAHVQWVAMHYGPIFARANLGAWKHISAISTTDTFNPRYKGSSVKIDAGTVLIWQDDATIDGEGHFYARNAAVARTTALNLYKELRSIGFRPEGRRLTEVTFYICGLHGSRRLEQPDNIHLVVNLDIYSIPFRELTARNEEVASLRLKPSSISIDPESVTSFTLIVLPFQERYPLPPSYVEDRRGPGHFRDVEVGNCFLEFRFDNT